MTMPSFPAELRLAYAQEVARFTTEAAIGSLATRGTDSPEARNLAIAAFKAQLGLAKLQQAQRPDVATQRLIREIEGEIARMSK